MINFQGPAKKETSTGRGFLETIFSPLSLFNSKQKAHPSSTYGAPPPDLIMEHRPAQDMAHQVAILLKN